MDKMIKSTYLVVADQTEEFSVALRYAVRVATASSAHIGIFYNMDIQDFTHWGNIEKRMREEMRANAEQELYKYARRVNELDPKQTPAIYLEEGSRIETLLRVIENDPSIAKLILASGAGSHLGPLISHFTTKGLARLRIPLTLVPGHLEPHEIDELTQD